MKKLLLAAALCALAAPATAGTLTYDSYSSTGIGSITITSPHGITGGAGPITLYDKGKVVVTMLGAWTLTPSSPKDRKSPSAPPCSTPPTPT